MSQFSTAVADDVSVWLVRCSDGTLQAFDGSLPAAHRLGLDVARPQMGAVDETRVARLREPDDAYREVWVIGAEEGFADLVRREAPSVERHDIEILDGLLNDLEIVDPPTACAALFLMLRV